MLINTVILFLRDALPIFVLIAYLSAFLQMSKLWLFLSLSTGALLSLIYINQIHVISQWFDGIGIELVSWWSQVFIYLLAVILVLTLPPQKSANKKLGYWVAGIMVSLTIVSKGSSFILYFDGYLNQNNVLQSMLLGTLLGLGISLSLAILLNLGAQGLRRRFGLWTIWLLIIVYSSGQLSNALSLLVQIDFISASATAWNSQSLLSNEFEFGHLFKVLFGYQASPSMTQVYVYALSIAFPLAVFYWFKHHTPPQKGNQ